MRINRDKPAYLPKIAFVRLHTAGKEIKDYQQELKGQGFTYKQFEHMKCSDEYWDGLEVWVSMWNYDNHEKWHLWNWKKEDDSRVMLAMYEAEQFHPLLRYENDFEHFKADWEAGVYDPGCTFAFPLTVVEVLEVVQEEEDNTDREAVTKAVKQAWEARCQKRRRQRVEKRNKRRKRSWKRCEVPDCENCPFPPCEDRKEKNRNGKA